jgi:Cof subfamily protein (haloacid dehalogenase superfamily)
MPKIKLIAIDIDGTLVPENNIPASQRNAEAIGAARDSGVSVTLASGRIYTFMRRYVDQLHLHTPIIACNGGDIRQNHITTQNNPIAPEIFAQVLEITRPFDLYTYYFSGNHIYLLKKDIDDRIYRRWDVVEGMMCVQDSMDEILEAVRPYGVQKVLVFPRSDGQERQLKKALAALDGKVNAVTGEKFNLEINGGGVSKAAALRQVAGALGVAMGDVMAIGDSENDESMLRAAGISVAPANADPVAMSAAMYTTLSSADDGVAAAIERFVL